MNFSMLVDVDSATYSQVAESTLMDALMTCVQAADVQAAQTNYLKRKTDMTQVGHTQVCEEVGMLCLSVVGSKIYHLVANEPGHLAIRSVCFYFLVPVIRI